MTVSETNQPPLDSDTTDEAQDQPIGPVKTDTPRELGRWRCFTNRTWAWLLV